MKKTKVIEFTGKCFNSKTDRVHLVHYTKNSIWHKLLGVKNETKNTDKCFHSSDNGKFSNT